MSGNNTEPQPIAAVPTAVPRHIAIIMDGNGRWAQRRGLPRTAGHRQGVEAVRETVRAAGDLGVQFLTLFSFSSENWNRPAAEISELFSLLRMFIRRDLAELHNKNVRLMVIGREEGVPEDVIALLNEAKNLTAENTGQTLIVAFNYGARTEIAGAFKKLACKLTAGEIELEDITEDHISAELDTAGIPDPDLLIRTSGEVRISNFLLWQLAYSEMVFVDCFWPDFTRAHLEAAIAEFGSRTRKFGGLVAEAGS